MEKERKKERQKDKWKERKGKEGMCAVLSGKVALGPPIRAADPKTGFGAFPSGPAKTLRSQCKGPGFDS